MAAEATSEAVVLRRTGSGEADRRLTLFTEPFGKLDVVAKGAKKPGSRLAGSSEPLVRAVFTWAEGRVRRFVTQVQPITSYPRLRADYDKTASALSLLELFAVSTPFESPLVGLYSILVTSLEAMEESDDALPALVWGQSRLLDAEGVHPDWTAYVDTGGPLLDNPTWVSPSVGGPVSTAQAYLHADGFPASAEVLIALKKVAEREAPPVRLRHSQECLSVLFRFWRHVLGERLPATESLIRGFSDQAG